MRSLDDFAARKLEELDRASLRRTLAESFRGEGPGLNAPAAALEDAIAALQEDGAPPRMLTLRYPDKKSTPRNSWRVCGIMAPKVRAVSSVKSNA